MWLRSLCFHRAGAARVVAHPFPIDPGHREEQSGRLHALIGIGRLAAHIVIHAGARREKGVVGGIDHGADRYGALLDLAAIGRFTAAQRDAHHAIIILDDADDAGAEEGADVGLFGDATRLEGAAAMVHVEGNAQLLEEAGEDARHGGGLAPLGRYIEHIEHGVGDIAAQVRTAFHQHDRSPAPRRRHGRRDARRRAADHHDVALIGHIGPQRPQSGQPQRMMRVEVARADMCCNCNHPPPPAAAKSATSHTTPR